MSWARSDASEVGVWTRGDQGIAASSGKSFAMGGLLGADLPMDDLDLAVIESG